MSLKAVEMQIAIPRTTEASKIQNDVHHKTSQEQQFLAGQQLKESQELRQRSSGIDETANAAVRGDGNQQSSGHGDSHSHKSKQEQEEHHNAEHPFKGRHFDVSL
ncbi:hypothetical protein P9847_06305 [Paenibacillus chibensis]|uniref:RNA polymerase subunit sigma n=1 Tax=Paenibacillus chibensis TaxID=59846 RepID=A0ABU6PRX9_9BACL|nr:hypothetical protein [Paenibacillus chibensis]MEC0373047.1 hypothetical protein [Paenibacillus chibensis]MED5016916.1 hypothetical protein [Paenibacillus chibensis]